MLTKNDPEVLVDDPVVIEEIIEVLLPRFQRNRQRLEVGLGASWQATLFGVSVARTIAQQLGKAVESVTAPFQYALATRAGGECIAHALQALSEVNPESTVLSID